jgi:phosphoribosyl 1,2-cyclic phosphodiesterase
MSLRVLSLGSGSTGNVLVVEHRPATGPATRVVVDAGLGPKAVSERLRALGDAGELFARGADAIVITHHHDDHVGRLGPLARALGFDPRSPDRGARIWLHDGIHAPRERRKLPVARWDLAPITVGGLVIEALPLPHDAPQIALRFRAGGVAFGMATDLGYAPRELERFLGACDEVFLESNHCPELLAQSPYPESVRARISGARGHLSNERAAEVVARLEGSRTWRVHLAHLSLRANTEARALSVVRARAGRIAVAALPHQGAARVDVSAVARPSGAFVQLGLAL